ncbi:MAG: hypothetical protein J6B90_11920 [Lachnospiraceae bacterium]|nr:hypothetical protein [Lachnospiraceae bacterium]
MERKIDVIDAFDGKKMVIIHDIIFKKKQYVEWKDVKEYLKRYVGEVYTILSAQENIYIGPDLPNEFTGSAYTYSLKGANVKAKANVVQGIPEMIEIAVGGNYKANDEIKHNRNAKYGWYRYDSYFAIPVHDNAGEVEHYNVFHASLLIRHAEDGKKYLYDIIDIKKETSYPLEP